MWGRRGRGGKPDLVGKGGGSGGGGGREGEPQTGLYSLSKVSVQSTCWMDAV